MAYDNERLPALIQQIERKPEVTEKMRELSIERGPINKQVLKLEFELEQAINREKALEKGGFSNILHRVSGKLDAKREEAHMEARSAKSAYDVASQKLKEIDDEISRIQSELDTILFCEMDYKQAFDDKVSAIKESSHPDKNQLLEYEKTMTLLQNYIVELKGAITTGDSARSVVSRIISLNSSSHEVSVSDILFKSTFTLVEDAIASHDRYKEAKRMTGKVYEQLDRFKERLVIVSGFAKDYADISFITKFINWINLSRNRDFHAGTVMRQIQEMLKKLEIVIDVIDNKRKEVKNKFDALVLQIRL